MSYGAIIAGVISAGAGIYSANKAGKAGEAAQAQHAQQQAVLAGLLDDATAQADMLRGERSDPLEVFSEMLRAMPGLLEQVLPSLRRQSTESAAEFTTANLSERERVLNAIAPGATSLHARRGEIIGEMDPANLGEAELRELTKQAAPFLPVGTLDPNTGAVAGTLTNPAALYRNLISGAYQQRRQEFLGATRDYFADSENAASRQQVMAQAFLPSFLSFGQDNARSLSATVLGREEADIAAADQAIITLLGTSQPSFDPSKYETAQAAGIKEAAGGVSSAWSAWANSDQGKSALGTNKGTTSAA